MRFITLSSIGAIALLSGAAHAGLEYSDIGFNDLANLDASGFINGNSFYEFNGRTTGLDAFGATGGSTRVIQYDAMMTSTDYPDIDAASFSGTHNIEVSESRFHWDWSVAFDISVLNPIMRPDADLSAGADMALTAGVTVTESTRVRVSLGGEAFNDSASTGLPNSIGTSLSSSTGSFADVSFNVASGGSDSLSFEYDAAAGEVISIDSFSQMLYANVGGFTGDLFLSQSGSITIEIVPAPATAALFGLSGLAAVRRRR